MEGMAHDGVRVGGDSRLESDEILMSVAMSRLCMQNERVVRTVRAEVCVNGERLVTKHEADGEGEIFRFDTDTEDNKEEDGDDDGGTMEGMTDSITLNGEPFARSPFLPTFLV